MSASADWADQGLGDPLIELATCGSTSDELSRLAGCGAAHGTVVRADRQTAGRGRGSRRWSSEQAGDLYASVLLRPALLVAEVPALSLVAGIAVARAVARFGVDARLKWPNDVVCRRRKLAGILCEASSSAGVVEHVIVGVGVNLQRRSFSPELAAIATSMALELGGDPPSPPLLLGAVLEELAAPLSAFAAGGVAAIRDPWTELCRDIGARATALVNGSEHSGVVRGITATGALELELASGELVAVVAGDVRIDYPR